MTTDALIAQIADQIEAPFWVYDADRIRAQINKLRPFDTIRYAQKALSNINILKLMRAEGVAVDAVSGGEIERALAAGYDPAGPHDPIVFTADIIDRATLARARALGIPINCGSPDMVAQVGAASPGHKVWLRINPGFGHGHSSKTNTGGPYSKHGIWHEYLDDSLALIDRYKLRLAGLHMHIGSGVDYRHLHSVCDAMAATARRVGRALPAISAGGGLSIPYRPGEQEIDAAHYYQSWDKARAAIASAQGAPVHLEIEPGRYLVGQCGVLVAEVYAVKKVTDHYFVMVNAGFNDLARPAIYGSHHEIGFLTRDGRPVSGDPAKVAVAGPLCESGDVFTQAPGGKVDFRDLALPKVGDLAVIGDAGAYGASMSSNYNTRPLVPEVLVDDGRAVLIRERQTVEQLIALEQAPRSLFG